MMGFFMEPLGNYRDVRIEGKRTFELFEDRLLVRGYVSLKSDFEFAFPLHVLNPSWSRIRIRSNVFQVGMMFFGAGLGIGTGAWQLHGPTYFAVLALSLGLAGVFMLLVTARKIEYAVFQNRSGVSVVTMARTGPDAEKFDTFVNLLAEKITQAKPPPVAAG